MYLNEKFSCSSPVISCSMFFQTQCPAGVNTSFALRCCKVNVPYLQIVAVIPVQYGPSNIFSEYASVMWGWLLCIKIHFCVRYIVIPESLTESCHFCAYLRAPFWACCLHVPIPHRAHRRNRFHCVAIFSCLSDTGIQSICRQSYGVSCISLTFTHSLRVQCLAGCLYLP